MKPTNLVAGPSLGQLATQWLDPEEYLEMAISAQDDSLRRA